MVRRHCELALVARSLHLGYSKGVGDARKHYQALQYLLYTPHGWGTSVEKQRSREKKLAALSISTRPVCGYHLLKLV